MRIRIIHCEYFPNGLSIYSQRSRDEKLNYPAIGDKSTFPLSVSNEQALLGFGEDFPLCAKANERIHNTTTMVLNFMMN
jgi:hypothetical protein